MPVIIQKFSKLSSPFRIFWLICIKKYTVNAFSSYWAYYFFLPRSNNYICIVQLNFYFFVQLYISLLPWIPSIRLRNLPIVYYSLLKKAVTIIYANCHYFWGCSKLRKICICKG